MTVYAPTASEATMLKHVLNNLAPTEPILKLYVNNVTPGAADTAGTYTEMSTQGYAAKTLAGASWSFNTGSRPATASFAAQTWTFDGTGGSTSVYGVFIVKTSSGLLLFAELFSGGPFTIVNNGDSIQYTPSITLT